MIDAMSQKATDELAFWQSRLKKQGILSNDHFEYFYTTHFGLDKAFYQGKRMLDIGCGPRGSLEWATGAALRVGVDPMAEAYRQLGTDRHAMQYVSCGAEELPFADASFDVVSSFNSLDHVDSLNQVIAEICRVLSPGGNFLLLTDIHRHPTVKEPMAFSWDIVERFLPALEVVDQKRLEYTVFSEEGFGDIYQSLKRGVSYDEDNRTERYGILSARLQSVPHPWEPGRSSQIPLDLPNVG